MVQVGSGWRPGFSDVFSIIFSITFLMDFLLILGAFGYPCSSNFASFFMTFSGIDFALNFE